jgi:hypothetical protein
LKFFGWEVHAIDDIMKYRNLEANILFLESVFKALLDLVSQILPALISLLVLSIYVYQGNELTH